MPRSANPRKRKPAPQRSKLPRYVVKLHDDDFFDEEDAEVLRFDNFDDAVECCADLKIPFFVDAGNKKLVFWFPNENSLLKLLYLGLMNAQEKWTMPIQSWNLTLSPLAIYFEGRLNTVMTL